MAGTSVSEALGRLDLLTSDDTSRWDEQLRHVDHDFYHTAAYHLFSQEQGEGEAFLAVYQEGESRLLWPYLLRPINGLGSTGLGTERYFDVTSVYGYPGPLGSRCEGSERFRQRAYDAILDAWRSQRAVSAFTRLHPLLANHRLLPTSRPASQRGQTISIDLTDDPETASRAYRKTLRHDIKKARRAGVAVIEDVELRRLDRFIELYHQTMHRAGAVERHFFSPDYFRRFFDRMGSRAYLMTAELDSRMIGGGIFVECDGIVQYHFSAGDEEFRHLAPSKLLLDEVRRRAAARGNHTLYLGGGTGGNSDSLFQFKSSFSKRTHPFHIWSAVILPAVYEELCRRRDEADPQEIAGDRGGFFPAYRRPMRSTA